MNLSCLAYNRLWASICIICAFCLVACQASAATPTLQPDEVEIPFTTVFLDEQGAVERPEGAALILVTNQANLATLQPLIKPEAWAATQGVDLATYDLLTLFRVPGYACMGSGLGVTIDRLTQRAGKITIQASDRQPTEGACAPGSASAYHIIQVPKADTQPSEFEFKLQLEWKERGPESPPLATSISPLSSPLPGGSMSLPFETLSYEEWGGGYEGQEPLLLLITQPAEIEQVEPWLAPEVQVALNGVDFTENDVVALFRGVMPSSNYQTVIEQIVLQEQRLVVHAQFWEPNPAWESATVHTSPHHLVTIPKIVGQSPQLQLVLRSTPITPTPPAD